MSSKIHIHLHVADLEASRSFYEAAFGPPAKAKPGYVKFLPEFAPLNLAISRWTTPPVGSRGVTHYGVQLGTPAEVQEHLRRVKSAGLATREEIGVDCCHANQDKFWVTDPDGNEWEFYHLNYDLEPAHFGESPSARPGDSVCPPACCGA